MEASLASERVGGPAFAKASAGRLGAKPPEQVNERSASEPRDASRDLPEWFSVEASLASERAGGLGAKPPEEENKSSFPAQVFRKKATKQKVVRRDI